MKSVYNEVLTLARRYVDNGHPTGGSLHIVLEDRNTEAKDVGWCIRYAIEHDDPDAAELGIQLLKLTEQERDQLSHDVWKGFR